MSRMDTKICYFCGEISCKKLILNPATKILNEVFLTAVYQGTRYPVCEKCGGVWDKELQRINKDYTENIDKLFEKLVIDKEAIKNDGEESAK